MMAHFNPEGPVTRLEVEADTTVRLGPERAKTLTAMLLGAQQSEPKLSKTPKLSTILEVVHVAPEPTDCAMLDPLIQGLVDRLRKPDSVWSLDDREKWLRAAAVITLVYKTDERGRDRHSSEPKALP